MNENTEAFHLSAYSALGPRNMLRHLNQGDRKILSALLINYDFMRNCASDMPLIRDLEEASRLAKRASELAADLDRLVINGGLRDLIKSDIKAWQFITYGLKEFRPKLGAVKALGKPGHKAKASATNALVTASELVKSRLETYCDEDLAELFQSIGPQRDSTEDLSGDVIRKHRAKLSENYPDLYRAALEEARRLYTPPQDNT